jgi:hypothetical protein
MLFDPIVYTSKMTEGTRIGGSLTRLLVETVRDRCRIDQALDAKLFLPQLLSEPPMLDPVPLQGREDAIVRVTQIHRHNQRGRKERHDQNKADP